MIHLMFVVDDLIHFNFGSFWAIWFTDLKQIKHHFETMFYIFADVPQTDWSGWVTGIVSLIITVYFLYTRLSIQILQV